MRLVPVATFTFAAQADLAVALLESQGIPCRLANEHLAGGRLSRSWAVGGVQVQVPEDAAEAARAALDGVAEPLDEDESRLVAVATFENPLDAHAAAMALDASGIPHRISGEGAFGVGARVSVLVGEEDAEAAREVLTEGVV